MHAGLFGLLIVSFRLPTFTPAAPAGTEQPKAIQAKVIPAEELDRVLNERRMQEERRRQAELERQRIALEQQESARRERERQIQLAREKAEQARIDAERRQHEAEERARQEREEAERRRREEEEARKQAEREAALQAALAEEESFLNAIDSGLQAQYVDSIQQKVGRNWIQPPDLPADLECIFRVEQIPGGEVVTVTMLSCNAGEVVMRSAETAIWKSAPLPSPPDPSLFERIIELNFTGQGVQ